MFVLIHVNLSHVLGTAALLLFRLYLVDLQHAFLKNKSLTLLYEKESLLLLSTLAQVDRATIT